MLVKLKVINKTNVTSIPLNNVGMCHIEINIWCRFQVGPKDAPPVLMFHGWLDNCYSFVPLLTMLPKNRRYIALDLPGHGHSSHKPTGCYNLILSMSHVYCLQHYVKMQDITK